MQDDREPFVGEAVEDGEHFLDFHIPFGEPELNLWVMQRWDRTGVEELRAVCDAFLNGEMGEMEIADENQNQDSE